MKKGFVTILSALTMASAWFIPMSVSAETPSLKVIEERLVAHPLREAAFKETRSLKAQGLELTASGFLRVDPKAGTLLWKQTDPFVQTLRFKDQTLSMAVEDDPPEVISAKDNPQLFSLISVVQSLITVDIDRLESLFSVKTEPSKNGGWVLVLIPKDALVKTVFTSVRLEGQTQLERVTLLDQQGNETRLVFGPYHAQ